ncbi:MAG: histidine phosphatase family protein [Alphaproteobacteria bacterium]|nr:MAG: histidine phosphatase family protein [Alphaproteobacteria bacterium]
MNRRGFLLLAAGAPLLAACGQTPRGLHGRLIILRHADRTFAPLNAKGRARAAQLPEALADLPIDAIYTSQRQRNIDTATPLAKARGLPVQPIPPLGAGTRILTEHPGQTVVWVGNQENLGFLYLELGIPAKPPVQFGEIHVVTIPGDGGPPTVEIRHYGD